eukprot:TRINITY_DN512_c0_g1_i19.p2 TRINITY_DN512_c0_g1~~TRINITY_DN512_c0_g1_i19.p2  ORF type:complete len:121 (-),score=10.57 TRINITY_DN512_c0_g1_i19:670-1032(-)
MVNHDTLFPSLTFLQGEDVNIGVMYYDPERPTLKESLKTNGTDNKGFNRFLVQMVLPTSAVNDRSEEHDSRHGHKFHWRVSMMMNEEDRRTYIGNCPILIIYLVCYKPIQATDQLSKRGW